MTCRRVYMFVLIIETLITLRLSYKIDVYDGKMYEIESDDMDYSEQDENEMIKPKDLVAFESLAEDASRYKPLHSYVESYNRREAENRMQFQNGFPYVESKAWEKANIEPKEEAFVAGFKEDLDKVRRDTFKRDADFFRLMRPRNPSVPLDEYENEELTPRSQGVTSKKTFDETEPPDEESYDYELYRKEYDEQISKDINSNKTLNYTDQTESVESPKEVLKELLDYKSKNCSKESKRLGIQMIECLVTDYQHAKNKAAVRKTLSEVWLVIKIWLLIYACIAIPCWCHRGWCCCCFRCKLCFPRRRILIAKKYYAKNPPGSIVDQTSKEPDKLINYDPSRFERDAYVVFEAAIRNL